MTDEARTVAARRLRPYWDRVLALESPVDEEQRDSGLIVPLAANDEGRIKRAVVTALGSGDEIRGIRVGSVIYFEAEYAHRVLDAWVVDPNVILAYEEDE